MRGHIQLLGQVLACTAMRHLEARLWYQPSRIGTRLLLPYPSKSCGRQGPDAEAKGSARFFDHGTTCSAT